jgi:hypothetical protein
MDAIGNQVLYSRRDYADCERDVARESDVVQEVKDRGSEYVSLLKEAELGTYSRNAVSSRENRGTDSGHGASR